MSESPRSSTSTPSRSSRPAHVDGSGRIVKKAPPLPPLESDRKYVAPRASNVSVLSGFVHWAAGQSRGRKVKVDRRSFGPDGLQSPNPRSRDEARFQNYFALGTEKDHASTDADGDVDIHRNRLVFLLLLGAVVLYTLVWILG